MTTLITGITGFLGGHLAEHLLDRGERIVGIARTARWPAGLQYLAPSVPLAAADLLEPSVVRSVLQKYRPGKIYHLAGHAFVPDSLVDPARSWNSNFVGSRILLDAVVDELKGTKIVLVSSGLVYGQPEPQFLPITEMTPLDPQTPYAVAKAAGDLLAIKYFREKVLDVVVVRPFNLIGPRQRNSFALAHFASQIARIEECGEKPNLRVGQLNVLRDFTDVRDAARACGLLMERAPAGSVVNLASASMRSVGSLLDGLLALSAYKIEVVQDPNLLRRSDPPRLHVSNQRLRTLTGWEPLIPIAETLADTLNECRERMRRGLS